MGPESKLFCSNSYSENELNGLKQVFISQTTKKRKGIFQAEYRVRFNTHLPWLPITREYPRGLNVQTVKESISRFPRKKRI